MQTIIVERTIKAPIEKVFAMLSDHANYKQFPGVTGSTLLKPGKTERDGLGAVRRIETPKGWFEEEITAFERPRRFEYLILRTSLPLEHQGGSVRLEATADGTHVIWASTLRMKVPLIGGLLTRIAAPTLGKAFGSMLKEVDRRLVA